MQKVMIKQTDRPKDSTVYIEVGALAKIGTILDFSRYTKAFVVTDVNIERLWLEKLTAGIPIESAHIAIEAGEDQKQLPTVEKLWTAMLAAGCDRKSVVINLGGGVIGDLGGFAASTYMRGLDFINVPTTLLAQIDSSAGGKTGFNFAGIKNLIGSFNQPVAVIIDPMALSSLSKRQLISGFAEAIKHGLIWDRTYFDKVSEKPPEQFTSEELAIIITRSCEIKAEIIQGDLKEGGKRKLVNFGHTIGHALEALSHQTDQSLLHGEAVSIGMVVEADCSRRTGLLEESDLQQIKTVLQKAGLPIQFAEYDFGDIFSKMKSDKKNAAGKINFTLLHGIGKAGYDQQVPEEVVLESLKAAEKS